MGGTPPPKIPSSTHLGCIHFLPEVTLLHTLHRKWYPSCITTFRPLKLFIQGRSTKTILPLTKSKSFISNPKRRDVLYYPPDLSDCVTTFCPTNYNVCTLFAHSSDGDLGTNIEAPTWRLAVGWFLCSLCSAFPSDMGRKKSQKRYGFELLFHFKELF